MNEPGLPVRASAGLTVVLTARFLLELALLAGAAVIALRLPAGWWRWPVAILAVAVIAAVWGLLVSPKAAIPVPRLAALGLEATLFIGIGAGLVGVGLALPAGLGVAFWIVHRIALAFLQN